MEQNACLKCFLTKYGSDAKMCTKRYETLISCIRDSVVEDVINWISLSSTLTPDRGAVAITGMHESKSRTFRAENVKAQTVNNCC